MSSVLAVITRDPNLMPCELMRLREKVRLAGGDPTEAIGVGYISGHEVLLRKKPGPVATTDIYEIGKDIEAESVVCHARRDRARAFKDENTQPFRYRRWLFAHAGAVEAFGTAKPAILAALPDYLVRQIKGDMDSELAFMHFLLKLPALARTDDADVSAVDAGRALGEAARTIDRLATAAGATRTSTLNLVATNGRVLVATRLGGGPLFYAPFEGMARCEHCGITEATADTNPLVRSHRMLRSVAVTSDVAGKNTWIEVPEAHVICVSRALDLKVAAI
jgi:glutamine amidotransferase